jgi:hypothetical protein
VAVLRVIDIAGEEVDDRYPLHDTENTIGRDPSNDIMYGRRVFRIVHLELARGLLRIVPDAA